MTEQTPNETTDVDITPTCVICGKISHEMNCTINGPHCNQCYFDRVRRDWDMFTDGPGPSAMINVMANCIVDLNESTKFLLKEVDRISKELDTWKTTK